MTEFIRRLPARDLDPSRLAQRRATAGLLAFLLMLAVLVFTVETLSRLGVDRTILIWVVTAFGLAVPTLAGVFAPRTWQLGRATSARDTSVAANAAATTTALFGGVFALGFASLFFRSEADMSAPALGLCGGLLLGGVLFAPYFRRSAAVSPGDFLAARFGGREICAIAAVIAGTALFPMLVAQTSVAAMVSSWMLGIGRDKTVVAVAILMLAPALIGGMRGITVAAVLQFVLLLVALVAASMWVSGYATGHVLPIPGYVAATARLEELNALGNSPPAWELAGLGLCVSLGVAALPILLLRSTTTRSSREIRMSVAWVLLLVALLATASATMASVVRWLITEGPAKSDSIADLVSEPWIVEWVARDKSYVTLCGEPASQAGSTCSGALKAGDLAIDPDIALVAAPQIVGVPTFLTMLMAVGCVAASIGAGSLLVFGIGRSIGHDLLFRALMPRAPASRRVLIERLLLVLAAAAAVRVASNPPADYLQLALASLSVSASGLFPVMLAAVWWPRANRFGALAGMIAGFAVALYLAAATIRDPTLLAWLESVGLVEMAKALGIEKAALVAVPVGLFFIGLVSMITPGPGAAQRQFANALRSPRDMPAPDAVE
jgi:cation/acetate symporter